MWSFAQTATSPGVRSGLPVLSARPRFRSCRNCWYSRDTLQQAGRLKVFQTLWRRPSASPVVEHLANVAHLDDAEGRDGGEGGALLAIQLVGPLPLAHDLALWSTRHVHLAREHASLVASPAGTFPTTA